LKLLTPQIKPFINSLFSDQEKSLITNVILIPTVFTLFYLYALMPDKYISETRLAIHNSEVAVTSNDLFTSLGFSSKEQNDIRLFEAFLKSPYMARKADEVLNLKEHYSSTFDFLFGLERKATIEEYLAFYLERVIIALDPESGLLILQTQSYNPETALKLNELLLKEGESFINDLNSRIAQSEMLFAQGEIASSLKTLHKTRLALADFQSEKNLSSPEAESQSIITIIYALETSLAETKALLGETLTYLTPESAQAKTLSAKIQGLEAQIEEQKGRLTGSEIVPEGISRVGINYEDLTYDVELARVVYETSVSSFELARNQANKQLKHLLIASSPVLPEKSTLPNRGYWLVTLFLLYTAVFGIIRMVIRSINEHKE